MTMVLSAHCLDDVEREKEKISKMALASFNNRRYKGVKANAETNSH